MRTTLSSFRSFFRCGRRGRQSDLGRRRRRRRRRRTSGQRREELEASETNRSVCSSHSAPVPSRLTRSTEEPCDAERADRRRGAGRQAARRRRAAGVAAREASEGGGREGARVTSASERSVGRSSWMALIEEKEGEISASLAGRKEGRRIDRPTDLSTYARRDASSQAPPSFSRARPFAPQVRSTRAASVFLPFLFAAQASEEATQVSKVTSSFRDIGDRVRPPRRPHPSHPSRPSDLRGCALACQFEPWHEPSREQGRFGSLDVFFQRRQCPISKCSLD